MITWKNGWITICPPDDLPYVRRQDGLKYVPRLKEIDPDRLFYVEPFDISGPNYPCYWGFDDAPASRGDAFFPPYQHNTLKHVLDRVGREVSVHAEVFSPFSQFMELLEPEGGRMLRAQ